MRLSASGVHHARECAWIYRTDVHIQSDNRGGRASKTGTLVHELIAHYLNPAYEVAFPAGANVGRAHKLYDSWRNWWTTFRGRRQFIPEVAMAYNPTTQHAYHLSSKGPRNYDKVPRDYVVGTADVVSRVDHSKFGRHAVVMDWKTSIYGGLLMEPAESNSQLATLALAAHRLYEVDRVRVALVHLSADRVLVDEAWLDVSHFVQHRQVLQQIQAITVGRRARPQPCNKCFFCPANQPKVCPAMGFEWPDLLKPATSAYL